jgi:dTDP-4-dehydrorhamnose 3,5-epimerase
VTFHPTEIPGVVLVESRPFRDDRGSFARTFCAREFEAAGLSPAVAQANVAASHRAGTLRGLHFQLPPAAEAKLVRCTRGRIFDVAVDLRAGSPTYLRHVHALLDPGSETALYVPEGCAHAYLTLEDDTEVTYQASQFYTPEAEDGLRWDDPALAIGWPAEVRVVSPKDAAWPLLADRIPPAL